MRPQPGTSQTPHEMGAAATRGGTADRALILELDNAC